MNHKDDEKFCPASRTTIPDYTDRHGPLQTRIDCPTCGRDVAVVASNVAVHFHHRYTKEAQ